MKPVQYIVLFDDNRIMKRDIDIIRNILLQVENSTNINGVKSEDLVQDSTIHAYNFKLLVEEEYLHGKDITTYGSKFVPEMFNVNLSMLGHDFLDATRDDGVWQEVKSKATTIGSWTMGVLLEIAKVVIAGKIANATH